MSGIAYKNNTIDELISKKQNIYEDENIRISYIDNNSNSTVIVFAYGMITLTEPPKESLPLYTKNDKNIIHIVDLKVSWFNTFTADFILSKINNLIYNKTIYIVGASMGAFNAIYFSNFIKSEICVGFGPQFSVKDPDPDRYGGNMKFYMDRLESVNVHTLNFSKTTEYRIIFGSDDEEQRSISPTIEKCKKENIKSFFTIFDDSPHLILNYLNDKSGPPNVVVEDFLFCSEDEIIKKYSSYSSRFFKIM